MKRLALLVFIVALLVTILPAATLFAQPAEGQQCRAVYVVKRGDMLSHIAAYYGVSTKTLQQANHINNRNVIYVGQRICIPGYKHPKPPPPPPSHKPPPHPPGYYPPPAHPGDGGHPPPPQQPCNYQPCNTDGYIPPPPHPGDGSQPATCQIPPKNGFGNVWYNNYNLAQRIGCPTDHEVGLDAVEQQFKNAYVVNSHTDMQIYVFFNNGYWEKRPSTWQQGDPVINPQLRPPYGWCQPEYGIGKMWRNDDNFSQRTGWAKWPQQPVQATRQTYQNGEMLWTGTRGVFTLFPDGTYKHN